MLETTSTVDRINLIEKLNFGVEYCSGFVLSVLKWTNLWQFGFVPLVTPSLVLCDQAIFSSNPNPHLIKLGPITSVAGYSFTSSLLLLAGV